MSESVSGLPSGLVFVAVKRQGASAPYGYWSECSTCGWRCHKQPHNRAATAQQCAKRHMDRDHADLEEIK